MSGDCPGVGLRRHRQAVALSTDLENNLVQSYLQDQDIQDQATLELYLNQKGWSHADLRYFATKAERLIANGLFLIQMWKKISAQKLDLITSPIQ